MTLIGFSAFYFLEQGIAIKVVCCSAFFGLVLGVLWAERIRRTMGIITFTAYLLSTPEIDGWRDATGKKIQRKVT